MLSFSNDEMVLLEAPEAINSENEEYTIKEYKYNGKKGSVLILRNKSYRIICREDSNTILVKEKEELSKVSMRLECSSLPYGEKDLLEILPEVPIDRIEEEKYYLPVERIEQIIPMAYSEYLEILKRHNGVVLEKKKKKYFGRIEEQVALDAFLLTRSLLVSHSKGNLQEKFEEVLPGALYQIVAWRIDEKTKEEALSILVYEIVEILKGCTSNEEELHKAMRANGIV
ncbi:hypothetical protein NEFER03_0592 [Nematocida sp. LUAm3]|nr:hypothetical protein NEFER03_0592 [Nematocida sp. LUAm3]KAI5175559.1 hypothetical protein NEFER02_1465 [Nematocida sp. LUAm2]KAI5178411.1 hypothetical protein NEFER01_1558 [Nematocida sp. LUAm1]